MLSDPGRIDVICTVVFIGSWNVSVDERGAGTPYTKAAGSSSPTPASSTEPEIARNQSNTTSKKSEVHMRKMQFSPRYIVLVCVFLLSSCLLSAGKVSQKKTPPSPPPPLPPPPPTR